MIVDKDKMDIESFKNIFNKKFKNFCSKLPILVSYQLLPNGVIVYEHLDENDDSSKTKITHYSFDYSDSVQHNIYNIKKILYSYFPVMIQNTYTEVEATNEETNQMVSDGEVSLEDITPKGYMYRESFQWQIEKVIVDRDELFIRNLTTKELRRYKLKYPVVTFLKRIRKGEFTPETAWYFFIERAVNKTLDPFDEGKEEESER